MESDLVSQDVIDGLFPDDNQYNEMHMLTMKCKKISRWNQAQDRILLLSTHFIYLLNDKSEVRKNQGISRLKYIVKSTKSNEILLYFTDETDLRLILTKDDKDEFLDMLKLRFASLCPKVNLKVFGVPSDSLKEYKSLNVSKGTNSFAFDNEPADMYRIKNEEIMTQKEYEDEKKKME